MGTMLACCVCYWWIYDIFRVNYQDDKYLTLFKKWVSLDLLMRDLTCFTQVSCNTGSYIWWPLSLFRMNSSSNSVVIPVIYGPAIIHHCSTTGFSVRPIVPPVHFDECSASRQLSLPLVACLCTTNFKANFNSLPPGIVSEETSRVRVTQWAESCPPTVIWCTDLDGPFGVFQSVVDMRSSCRHHSLNIGWTLQMCIDSYRSSGSRSSLHRVTFSELETTTRVWVVHKWMQ